MTTAMATVSPVHEEVHTDANDEQADEDSVAREDMGPMLIEKQETGNPQEEKKGYPNA